MVAQSGFETGGTWSGTVTNLRGQYSPVFCFRDGTKAMDRLSELGATLIDLRDLNDLSKLQGDPSLFAK